MTSQRPMEQGARKVCRVLCWVMVLSGHEVARNRQPRAIHEGRFRSKQVYAIRSSCGKLGVFCEGGSPRVHLVGWQMKIHS